MLQISEIVKKTEQHDTQIEPSSQYPHGWTVLSFLPASETGTLHPIEILTLARAASEKPWSYCLPLSSIRSKLT